ncbi:MAG TPA: hypothetical protein VJH03_14720 [Blastocatellia bacterium]|nr:hypothetical protein [Blastocatellia bacterium]
MKSRIIKLVSSAAVVFACMCLFSTPTYAQQEKGDKSVQLLGSFLIGFGEEDIKQGTVVANLGYFATRNHEVGVGVILLVQGGAGTDTTTLAGPNGYWRYNFGAAGAKSVPYMGVEGGGIFGSDDLKVGFVRPHAGFKYYFKRNVAFDLNVGYIRGFATFSGESGGANLVDTRIGLSFVF